MFFDEKSQYQPDRGPPPPEYNSNTNNAPSLHLLYEEQRVPDSFPPPTYPSLLPATFPVGAIDTPILVSVGDVEAHLGLLAAFWQLKQDVINQDWNNIQVEARWMIFVTRSVFRFEQWYLKVVCNDGRKSGPLRQHELPPLDVAMIWHAYLLNPSIYLEDGLTRTESLFKLGSFPLKRLASEINVTTKRPFEALPERIDTFEQLAGEPFVPSLSISTGDLTVVRCPKCQEEVRVPWIVADLETGYGQAKFAATCPSCNLTFGKEALGVRRFCEHAKSWTENPSGIFLAGTYIDHVTGLPDPSQSVPFNKRLLNYFKVVGKDKTISEMAEFAEWSIVAVENFIRIGMRMVPSEPSQPRLRRVLNHYRHPGPFSIDLVDATIRQGSFIEEMVKNGWTESTRFAADKSPLIRTVSRYHAWLDLLSSSPTSFFVPTLDIDLVWHTNMLAADRYRSETHRLLSRIPDHDDKVEELALSNGFDVTARAWKARFGVPYSYCGCVPAPDPPSTVGRFNKMKNKVLRREHPSRLDPTSALELVSTKDAHAAFSHPSDHNSVLFINHPLLDKARNENHEEMKKRLENLERAAAKGKGDVWDAIIVRRHAARHYPAFQASRPGNASIAYLPYIVDGSSLVGGRCAAGVSGGLCQTGGAKAFCGKGSQCGSGVGASIIAGGAF